MPGFFLRIAHLPQKLPMKGRFRVNCSALLALLFASAVRTYAGGSGLNTVVIVNQASSNSLALANYYAEKRQIPPENIIRINWQGGNTTWHLSQFETNLLQPFLSALSSRQLTNQADFVVLSMDIPYSIVGPDNVNSTTSALFYGFKGMDWESQDSATNSFAGSESAFYVNRPASAVAGSFLATMLTANTLTQAMRIVDQGIAGDTTFPRQSAWLAKTSDPLRNIRHRAFDNAVFNARIRNACSLQRTNSDSPWGQTNLLGYATGLYNFSLTPNAFVPGAMADNLTSYGGVIFGPNSQTTLMSFLNAGASGSYGTVTEPQPIPDKFPDPQIYFYQSRGFNLAECYYLSLTNPHQGLIVGEPLSSPFARPGSGNWSGLPANAVLHALTNLTAQFTSPDERTRLQQVDLFIDGKFHSTLTNIQIRTGNKIHLTLNGHVVTCDVPANATLSSTADSLVANINASTNFNVTRISAATHGDRIELQSMAVQTQPPTTTIVDSPTNAPSPAFFYTARRLPTATDGKLFALSSTQGVFRLRAESSPGVPVLLAASTNLADWLPIAASPTGDTNFFNDEFSFLYPRRFYRFAPLSMMFARSPKLATITGPSNSEFKFYIESAFGSPYALQSSSNLITWSTVLTNASGSPMIFSDPAVIRSGARFFRTINLNQPNEPKIALTGKTSTGANILTVQDPIGWPNVILRSTNLVNWLPIFTNETPGGISLSASTSPGNAATTTVFAEAAKEIFPDSPAYGIQQFSFNGIIQSGAAYQLDVTKTNGERITVSVTNQNPFALIQQFVTEFVSRINSNAALAAADGLVAEDLTSGFMGGSLLNLRARSPGLAAAAISVRVIPTGMLNVSPSATVNLTQNISDLRPRNHIYLGAGATNLSVLFALDTSTLSDGYHELTAVAHEGSQVRTQTRCTPQARVQNTAHVATLAITNATAIAPLQTNLQILVMANTNIINSIELFSTGGLLATATNKSTAAFSVPAPFLGLGRHPFYAIVTASNGSRYRTDTTFLRLISP